MLQGSIWFGYIWPKSDWLSWSWSVQIRGWAVSSELRDCLLNVKMFLRKVSTFLGLFQYLKFKLVGSLVDCGESGLWRGWLHLIGCTISILVPDWSARRAGLCVRSTRWSELTSHECVCSARLYKLSVMRNFLMLPPTILQRSMKLKIQELPWAEKCADFM